MCCQVWHRDLIDLHLSVLLPLYGLHSQAGSLKSESIASQCVHPSASLILQERWPKGLCHMPIPETRVSWLWLARTWNCPSPADREKINHPQCHDLRIVEGCSIKQNKSVLLAKEAEAGSGKDIGGSCLLFNLFWLSLPLNRIFSSVKFKI